MNIVGTDVKDVYVIENKVFGDERGWFSEVYRVNVLKEYIGDLDFVQLNESHSAHNILRGLHYQKPHSQGKLVRVVKGEVFDVAVDLRQDSPTFLKWYGIILSDSNHKQLWIPPGFAHGFYVTGEHAHFVYACTDYYAKEAERCIVYNDEKIGIKWPIAEGEKPILSDKDLQGDKVEKLLESNDFF